MRKHSILSLACFFLAWFGVRNAMAERPVIIPAGEYSAQYIQEARSSAAQALQEAPNMASARLVDYVMRSLYSNHPSLGKNKGLPLLTILDCENKSTQELMANAAKKFPDLPESQLNQEAEKKYPMYKKGDHITVRYRKHPQVIDKVDGAFYGFNGNEVRVAARRIVLKDMVGIPGNDVEITKLNPELNQTLRQEYIKARIAEQKEKRQQFIFKNDEGFFQRELIATANANEKNGYVFCNGHWMQLQDFVTELCNTMVQEHRMALDIAQKKHDIQRNDALQHMADSIQLSNQMTLFAGRPDIPGKIQENAKKFADEMAAAAARAKAASQAKEKQAAASAVKSESGTAQASAASPVEAKKKLTPEEERQIAEAKKMDLERQLERENRARNIKFFVTLGVAFVVIMLIGGIVYLRMHKKEDENRFAKFFEGKGKLQKSFWDMAEADPENFKYVAYMFPSVEEANMALSKLSYITVNANGDLKSTKNIYYGSYAHRGGAVAFVGGTKLNYAAWKEASALLPELEGAQYFKVSQEPVVAFVPPDSSILGKKIRNGEVEELQNEDGSVLVCYNYMANTKDDAILFLNDFAVDESGILVRVTTPEGDICKTDEGLVEMETIDMDGLQADAAESNAPSDNQNA